MKLMHIEALVPVQHIYDVMRYLEQKKAYNVKVSAFANGEDAEDEPMPITIKNMGTIKVSAMQQEWIAKHVKDEITSRDIRSDWIRAGFNERGLYGALSRAVKNKVLKKMASGTYKPTGA